MASDHECPNLALFAQVVLVGQVIGQLRAELLCSVVDAKNEDDDNPQGKCDVVERQDAKGPADVEPRIDTRPRLFSSRINSVVMRNPLITKKIVTPTFPCNTR